MTHFQEAEMNSKERRRSFKICNTNSTSKIYSFMIKRRRFFPSHESSPQLRSRYKRKNAGAFKNNKDFLGTKACSMYSSWISREQFREYFPSRWISSQYVRVIWSEYRKKGEDFLLGERRGGRRNILLEQKEEEEFLAPFFEKAKTGGILIVSEIHRAHKKRIGKDIPSFFHIQSSPSSQLEKNSPQTFTPKRRRGKERRVQSSCFSPNRRQRQRLKHVSEGSSSGSCSRTKEGLEELIFREAAGLHPEYAPYADNRLSVSIHTPTSVSPRKTEDWTP
jgi:hypothetical protein